MFIRRIFVSIVLGSLSLVSAPLSAEEAAVVQVPDPEAGGYTRIPPSFLGFSQEWPWVNALTGSEHIFSIFDLLRNGKRDPLILRIGGVDGDAGYDGIFNPEHKDYNDPYSIMKRNSMANTSKEVVLLKNRVGFRFIATVNLANRNPGLAQSQADMLRSSLGDALVSLEIGNEPNYYLSHVPQYWTNSGTFYSDIVTEFESFTKSLACQKNCAGPAWGWIGLNPDMMRNYLRRATDKLNFVTVHYYKSAYKPNQPGNDTAETLLQETDVITKWIRPQVKVSREFGVPLRISESNAVSGGGNDGVSNSFAAALWTLDMCLSMAAEGVAGIDFHQGSYRYAMYERVPRGDGNPADFPLYQNYRVQPSFYGMLFFQIANRDESDIRQLAIDPGLRVKGYQLFSKEGSRTVLVNKDPWNAKSLRLALPQGLQGKALRMIELLAPGSDITAKKGITLAGQSYEGWGGAKSGGYAATVLTPETQADGQPSITIALKPASAVMILSP
ncbi:MAG TPA: glycosyl hydrolase family 79 C-terminal domain-containing protein [Oligoflexus sp.]|uniref:glycosyl hydrolase family 79 C-terminal domain-containing protein n=1 Tax=Oligoflexus sp. TaxID=1971216 RepID=UPI002D7F42D3|nr:glycosyl hydrolase family 79 C-terminal domain-containing protein [Oligoflexus sp.]HET9235713.1 glycosyl hydrolase family 79 C-terminal domain-containing protein [Oligoflexus sp.]